MKLTLYSSTRRIAEIYGTFVTLGLIAYFLISYFGGFINVIAMRILNFPILAAGIWMAVNQYKRTHFGALNYFRAATLGMATTMIGVSTFVLFLFAILSIDRGLYDQIITQEPMGIHLNVFIATSAVWFEGIFSGMMATYIIINFIETDRV
jgi:hypothetical protein